MPLSNFSRRILRRAAGISFAATAAAACSSNTTNAQTVEDPTSYDDQFSSEMEAERQEFIDEQEERIAELDREIGQLETRVEHESAYVSESERADWKQELFELKREKEDARARLERARTASAAEWQAARGDAAVTVDRLEAGVATLATRIGRVFTGQSDSAAGKGPTQSSDVQSQPQERQPVRGEQEPELVPPERPEQEPAPDEIPR